jgi:exonuclease III
VERDIEMRIANWNVHTLYRVGAMNELVKEMGKFKIDICALQEIVARERNCDKKDLYDFV